MRRIGTALVLLALTSTGWAQRSYLGFDKDEYPGDAVLPELHKTFAFAGYWLNNPPGMQSNPWKGKRAVVDAAGFGFLLVFNGRLDAQLQHVDAAALGRSDGADAAGAAKEEGFPRGAVIFLDQEEGGALLAEQASYMGAWITAVRNAGFGAGVYVSGIPVAAGAKKISTAQDAAQRFAGVKLWVWDDRCPPAPGCTTDEGKLYPQESTAARALVWQYALSPRKPEDTAACAKTYAGDSQCYAPGLPHSGATFVDLNVSDSADPSRGR